MIYARQYANHYDLFYRDKPYREEAAYAAGLVRARSPRAKTMVDLGCGTGLRSLEFARLGFEVLGLDQSEAMLDQARGHLAVATDLSSANVEFRSGDVTAFQAQPERDAVVSLFHVFSYLTTDEALNEALGCSFGNLNSGGVLLIDYWHGPGVIKDPPVVRKKQVESGSLKLEKTTVPEHLPAEHLVRLNVSLEIVDKANGVHEETNESYVMRYWFTDELEKALGRVGFIEASHYAWMMPSAPAPETWQACTIAVKPR
ncbi:MAG TPA: class I SAM-dependent methyltransferase [Chthoniobacterales bacterium]|jgi:SAM-dependent methyltransferase|nr:class I SAM-dependent methyltransferase [Chthoniobacterales bacterium]